MGEDHAVRETMAIQKAFKKKRDVLLGGLEKLGVRTDVVPDGTFYVWGNVSRLPPKLATGMAFFRAALEREVIVVPGEFFDVNPGKRRSPRASRFKDYVRFSFGPAMSVVEEGLSRIERMVTSQGA
jgi:aspartate/methionine/tyrosine aminotransferase